jgi:hypothetical protein
VAADSIRPASRVSEKSEAWRMESAATFFLPMSPDPYSPPTATVGIERPPLLVPHEILKKIKGAWVAGIISGCMTLLVTLLAVAGVPILGADAWYFIDVVFLFGLTFGIYRKSRTCAVVMLVYFVVSKIITMMETGKPSGLLMGLLFAYFYFQGVVGTFAYHRFLKAQRAQEGF